MECTGVSPRIPCGTLGITDIDRAAVVRLEPREVAGLNRHATLLRIDSAAVARTRDQPAVEVEIFNGQRGFLPGVRFLVEVLIDRNKRICVVWVAADLGGFAVVVNKLSLGLAGGRGGEGEVKTSGNVRRVCRRNLIVPNHLDFDGIIADFVVSYVNFKGLVMLDAILYGECQTGI